MDGIGKCLAGLVLATCVSAVSADQPAKGSTDGMVRVPGLGWVYPDAHCVGKEVYAGGHPASARFYFDTHAVLHDCEHPDQLGTPIGPAKPSPSLVTPPALPARRQGQ